MKKPFSLKDASARWWVLLVTLGGASVATYLGRTPTPGSPARLEGRTMGTTWSVLLDGPRDEPKLAAVRADLETLFQEINASMSTYDAQSELSRFNARESIEPVTISAPLANVVRDALDVHRASGGRFDVTVGPLVEAWGFGTRRRAEQVPTEVQLTALLEVVGSDKLRLEGVALSKTHPGVQLDLSAIAKGDAVDRLSARLVELGEPNHLVDIGGELRARGVSVQGEAFRVGIEEPDPRRQVVRLAVSLQDRAIASSGNYRNFFEVGGVRYAHTIDPRTGRPTRHGLLAVSVLHERCGLADAWATALMAAGPEHAWALVTEQGLDALLLVESSDGGVQEQLTPGFEAVLLRGPEYARKAL